VWILVNLGFSGFFLDFPIKMAGDGGDTAAGRRKVDLRWPNSEIG
jgi:hypothetical protein